MRTFVGYLKCFYFTYILWFTISVQLSWSRCNQRYSSCSCSFITPQMSNVGWDAYGSTSNHRKNKMGGGLNVLAWLRLHTWQQMLSNSTYRNQRVCVCVSLLRQCVSIIFPWKHQTKSLYYWSSSDFGCMHLHLFVWTCAGKPSVHFKRLSEYKKNQKPAWLQKVLFIPSSFLPVAARWWNVPLGPDNILAPSVVTTLTNLNYTMTFLNALLLQEPLECIHARVSNC